MDDNGQRLCARQEWCSARTVTFEDGERIVTPALTYRPYCDACETRIGALLLGDPADPAAGMPALYGRLAAAIGDPRQADVRVPSPFGPVIPLREDIDAHMRVMADLLGGWAARLRATARLSAPGHAHGTAGRLAEDSRALGARVTVVLALQPGWMRRTFRLPLDDGMAAWLADDEIIRATDHDITVMTEVGGEDAGREILHMHYLARRLLLETNPPPEILLTPCRQCTRRALRRAWPDGERDLYSRCDRCKDEMTAGEYDVNARRWVAYHRAQQQDRPVLGEPAVA